MVKCNSCDYIGKPSRMQGSCFVCGSTDIQAQTEQEQQQLEQENKRYQLAVTSKVDELKKLLATAKEQRDTARLALKHFKNRAKIRRQFMLR